MVFALPRAQAHGEAPDGLYERGDLISIIHIIII